MLGKIIYVSAFIRNFLFETINIHTVPVTARFKNNFSFIPAAKSKIMEYFCHYRSYKTDICEYGGISCKDNTYITSLKLSIS